MNYRYLDYFEVKPKINKRLNNYLIKTKKDLDKFFGLDLDTPYVGLVNSRKDYNILVGANMPAWSVGWSRKGGIFIINEKVYTKESNHKHKQHFWLTLKHEHAHYYYRALTGISYPRWLNEGLCCYLAKQVKNPPEAKEALRVSEYFKKNDWKIYNIGYFWVNLLIIKFGKKRLLVLLKTLSPKITKRQFARNFKKIYGVEYSRNGLNTLL